MAHKPTWEEADLLLRVEQIASAAPYRGALDWCERTSRSQGEGQLYRVSPESPEFSHVLRLLDLFELLGTLTRAKLLPESLVHPRWATHTVWDLLQPTIERERHARHAGLGANFEWLAERSRRSLPKPSGRK